MNVISVGLALKSQSSFAPVTCAQQEPQRRRQFSPATSLPAVSSPTLAAKALAPDGRSRESVPSLPSVRHCLHNPSLTKILRFFSLRFFILLFVDDAGRSSFRAPLSPPRWLLCRMSHSHINRISSTDSPLGPSAITHREEHELKSQWSVCHTITVRFFLSLNPPCIRHRPRHWH